MGYTNMHYQESDDLSELGSARERGERTEPEILVDEVEDINGANGDDTFPSITDEQLEEYREAFKLFDANGDNTISPSELVAVMRTLGYNPTDDEVKDIIKEVDTDGNGQVEFGEFLHLMEKNLNTFESEELIHQAFDVIDRNGEGFVTIAKLRQVIAELGHEFTEEELHEMMEEADPDGDGRVSYKALIKLLSSNNETLWESYKRRQLKEVVRKEREQFEEAQQRDPEPEDTADEDTAPEEVPEEIEEDENRVPDNKTVAKQYKRENYDPFSRQPVPKVGKVVKKPGQQLPVSNTNKQRKENPKQPETKPYGRIRRVPGQNPARSDSRFRPSHNNSRMESSQDEEEPSETEFTSNPPRTYKHVQSRVTDPGYVRKGQDEKPGFSTFRSYDGGSRSPPRAFKHVPSKYPNQRIQGYQDVSYDHNTGTRTTRSMNDLSPSPDYRKRYNNDNRNHGNGNLKQVQGNNKLQNNYPQNNVSKPSGNKGGNPANRRNDNSFEWKHDEPERGHIDERRKRSQSPTKWRNDDIRGRQSELSETVPKDFQKLNIATARTKGPVYPRRGYAEKLKDGNKTGERLYYAVWKAAFMNAIKTIRSENSASNTPRQQESPDRRPKQPKYPKLASKTMRDYENETLQLNVVSPTFKRPLPRGAFEKSSYAGRKQQPTVQDRNTVKRRVSFGGESDRRSMNSYKRPEIVSKSNIRDRIMIL